MAIEGIDSLVGGRRARDSAEKTRRSKADDFPLFYRTRESMIIDEAIFASLRDIDADAASVSNEDGKTENKFVKGKDLTEKELNTIRSVVKDVDSLVQNLMDEAFRESYFTCGVLNCFIVSYVFGVYPQHLWLLYLVEMIFLLPTNLYHRINAKPLNKGLYYLDYCWIMNFVAVFSLFALVVHSFVAHTISKEISILSDSVRKQLFMAVLGTSCGPLLSATAALPYIALLFHDIDTMTSLFIHIFPPMVAYQLRWHSDAIRSAWPSVFHLNYLDEVHFLPLHEGIYAKIQHLPGTIAGNTLLLYVFWFVAYVLWMLLFGIDLPRKDGKRTPKFDTCFHSFMRGGACIAIGEALWKRPKCVSLQQVESNHFETRDIFVHMTYHAITSLASIFVVGYICYRSQASHWLALVVMTVVAVHRGARRYTYYSTSMYSRTLQKHFAIMLPSMSSNLDMCKEPDVKEEINCLQYRLSRQITTLRTRIGLVPNYFITRGESTPNIDTWSIERIYRRVFSRFLKLFQPQDFRNIESYAEFLDIVTKLGGIAQNCEDAIPVVISAINAQLGRHGNTILHELIKKRQLKFIKALLLHCGPLIDFDKKNRRGQSALDFGIDRLEVEIVFLLRLYGAKASSGVRPSSLGYAEWVFTDLTSNLDSGRWLNRQSIEAIMAHIIDYPLPRQQILDWAYGRNDDLPDYIIEVLGRIPQLYAITPADGCDAITNHEAWATLIRHLFSLHQMNNSYSDSNNLIQDESHAVPNLGELPVPMPCNDLYAFLKGNGIDPTSYRVAGRTIFYKLGGGDEYALKLSKTFEEKKHPHPLAKEAAMDTSMSQLKQRHGLESSYPSESKLISISNLPAEVRKAIEGQQSKGYHPFEVSKRSEGITALLYRPPNGYGRYANEPSLTLAQCQSGILKGAYDYAVLARNGLFHGALVDIQHDSVREQRPHLWSFESFLTRFRGGAGRIDRGFAALSSPNVRASGLGDLKHIINKKQVIERYDPSVFHAQHNILYDHKECFQVSLIEQLGAGLFATALLIASSWHGRHQSNIEPNLDLAKTLEEGFAVFLRGYLHVSPERAQSLLKTMGCNFDLMAGQIKCFATTEYVEAAESAPGRPLFGVAAKVLGWITHPTAFVHFMQRGGRDLSKPGNSLDQIKAAYQLPVQEDGTRLLPKGYPRVDTSMMRCSPTWVRGRGWVSPQGQPHFGSYEGVLPFQQLIRDLYAVAYLTSLMLLEEVTEPRHAPETDAEPSIREIPAQ